jgi:prepilin-type N-terminal cleavage/methylation domain-containing protein
MTARRNRARAACAGFSLIEVLAAMAIASAIIIATAGLIRDVASFFDRGARGASEAERLMLAVARLAGDFGAARFVPRRTDDGAAIAFAAEAASSERPARIMFVGAGVIAARSPATRAPDDELVSLTIEEDGELRRLVRRRAPWPGPRTRFEDVTPADPVVLLEGRFDMSFVFARVTPDGAMTWYASWAGEAVLPRYVRLFVRDRASGADLLGEAAFMVRASAPAACARPGAATSCLTAAPSLPPEMQEPERRPQ